MASAVHVYSHNKFGSLYNSLFFLKKIWAITPPRGWGMDVFVYWIRLHFCYDDMCPSVQVNRPRVCSMTSNFDLSSLFFLALVLTLWGLFEVIRQYDSCNTGELDRHAQHQQPCLTSRTLRVIVRIRNLFYQGHTGLCSRTVRCQ